MNNIKISFSTLGCPNWPWEKIISEAFRMGYDGIEIRGVLNEMYLNKLQPFLPENIKKTMLDLKEKNLEISCLDTSCSFHDKKNFEHYIQEGKDAIDLASKLCVKYIRVFGNNIMNDEDEKVTINRIINGLNILYEYSKDKDVDILLETHGDFASTDRILKILNALNGEIGVLWDINHPYKAFDEPIKYTYNKLSNYIKHIHVKDSIGVGPDSKLCLVGKGDLPLRECINILKENEYNGYLSLEWEKRWHQDLEEPEYAFEQYINYINNLLKE